MSSLLVRHQSAEVEENAKTVFSLSHVRRDHLNPSPGKQIPEVHLYITVPEYNRQPVFIVSDTIKMLCVAAQKHA